MVNKDIRLLKFKDLSLNLDFMLKKSIKNKRKKDGLELEPLPLNTLNS